MEDTQEIYDENTSSLLKIDVPIGKLKFFIYSLIIFLVQIFLTILYYLIYTNAGSLPASKLLVLLIILGILFGLPILYLNFVNQSKRLWDITGNKISGILWSLTIGLVWILLIFLPLTIVFWIGIYLSLIFISGKLIK